MFRNHTNFLTLFSGVLLGLLIVTHAQAAGGRMTIQQVSNTNQLGTWMLSTPAGETISDSRGEYLKTIDRVVGGTYGLRVTSPRKARTTIIVYRDNELIRKVEGSRLSFTVREDSDVRIVITHRFFGTIMVTSEPAGQAFVIKGADTVTYTGITPAGFNSVPPLHYTIEFDYLPGCRTPRNQSRLLDPNESLFFHGVYDCKGFMTVGEVIEEPEEEEAVKLLDITLTANQTEVLPGGTIRYELTVQNLGKRTAENLTISVQFDPAQGSVQGVRNDGKLRDDLVVWEIPKIYASRQWSTTFAMSTNKNLSVGDLISMTTRVSGEGLLEAGISEEILTQKVGVTLLPQTGWRAELFLAALMVLVSTLAFSICRKRYVSIQTV